MTGKDPRQEAEKRAQAGDLTGAGQVYERAGLHLEAAQAHQASGDSAAALASLIRIPATHPAYRRACLLAVFLADQQDHLTLALDNFLAHFIRQAPDDTEAEALETLARLYERHGFPENAAEILRKLAGRHPEYAEAALRLNPSLAPPHSGFDELPPLPAPDPTAESPALPESVLVQAVDEGSVFHSGAIIAGRYRLEGRIGVGGMSVVFRATDLEIGDAIAVKVLTTAVFDLETDARLRRELMLSRQLVHRNIVRVYEMGLAQGLRYLVMELLLGYRLADRLRGGALGIDEGLDYLAQACAGLQAAHDLGVVHRDVKPGNFFIVTGGVLKVMDFGLAKARAAPGLTATGVIAGTPAYMAPEQARDFRAVSPAADIYALGVVAYEMFTATVPFMHEDPLAVLIMHRETPPPPPRSRSPLLPEELEKVILRCLEKDPGRRFGSCRDLGQRLASLRLS